MGQKPPRIPPHDDAMFAPLVESSEQWADQENDPSPPHEPTAHVEVSRRGFLKTSGLAGLVASVMGAPSSANAAQDGVPTDKTLGPNDIPLTLTVNGKKHNLLVEARTTLADALRDQLGLTGTKVVCDRGACGGCTVHLNGTPVCSCMTLALDAAGAQVATVEGLAQNGKLDPIQQAFLECDALQCGFCTPGMLMSCKALLNRNPSPTLQDAKEAVSGNLCRCGTYPHVFKAVLQAAQRQRTSQKG